MFERWLCSPSANGFFRCALIVLSLLAAPMARADVVRGYVINPIDEVRITTAEVAFFVNQGGQLQEIVRKPTDAEGRFSFSGPFIQPGMEFVLAALYQGVPYSTTPLQVGAQDQVILEVYEPTSSAAQIEVVVHSIFLNVRPDGVGVGQLVQVENRGQQTFIGEGDGDQRRVMEFALPQGIFNLNGQLRTTEDGRFFDNRPLPPGLTQFFFSFDIDPNRSEGGYEHRAFHPTRQLDILLDPNTPTPEGPFEDMGPVDLHDQQYRRLALTDLEVGQRVWIPLPIARSLRWLLKWLALGGAVLAGLLLVLIKGRPVAIQVPELNAADLGRQRLELVAQLAQLDAAQQGAEPSDAYRSERLQLMDRAATVYRLLDSLAQDEPDRTDDGPKA